MTYRDHISNYTRERAGELLETVKDGVTFYGMSVMVLIPVALAANGVIGGGELPMIAQNGCNIGLDSWYIFFAALVCLKLLIEMFRYFVI